MDVPITIMVQRLELGEHKRLILTLWEKGVFCNWPWNSIFELHQTFATHHIYTLWVLLNKLKELQKLQFTIYIVQLITTQSQLNYNFVATTHFQLLCSSLIITMIISCWHHFSSIHQNSSGTMKKICDFFEVLISIFHNDYSF